MINTHQVTILGAGLVGLSQALALLNEGFKVCVIDKQTHPDAIMHFNPDVYDLRVLALTPQTSHFFKKLGVWDEIIDQRACPYQFMKVWDGKGSSQICFDAADFGVPNLGHMVEQSVVLQALLNKAKTYLSQGKLTWHVEAPIEILKNKPDEIGIKLSNGQEIYAKLLIGADGADSWLRTQAEISVAMSPYNQSAIVATIQTEKPHQNTAYQRFGEGGPLALLPLSDPNTVSIVWSQPTPLCESLLSLSHEEFNDRLTIFSEKILGNLSVVSSRKSFVLKSLQAKSYGVNRMVLIGDSAHVIHPLAGLGANLGFQDVISLTALVCKQRNHHRDVGSDGLMQRYYRERIAKNEAVRHSMTALNKLFTNQNPFVKLARNWGLDKANGFSGLKKWFANQAMGLS